MNWIGHEHVLSVYRDLAGLRSSTCDGARDACRLIPSALGGFFAWSKSGCQCDDVRGPQVPTTIQDRSAGPGRVN